MVLIASTLGWRALPDATATAPASSASSASPGRWPPSPGPGVTCLLPGGMATAFFDGVPNGTNRPDARVERPDGGRPQRAVRPRPASRMQCANCSVPEQRASLAVNILGVNAVFHDPRRSSSTASPSPAEEERFSRRKHGKPAVPFSTWELPTATMKWCLDQAGLQPPTSMPWPIPTTIPTWPPRTDDVIADRWEDCALYAAGHRLFLPSALRSASCVRFVKHHFAHAASAAPRRAAGGPAVLVLDGRGECHASRSDEGPGDRAVVRAEPSRIPSA